MIELKKKYEEEMKHKYEAYVAAKEVLDKKT